MSVSSLGSLSNSPVDVTHSVKDRISTISNRSLQLDRGHYLTAIQTVRCLSVIGFIGSLMTSVLLPAFIFGAMALTACVLKNRVEVKDKEQLNALDQTTDKVSKGILQRSESALSQLSNLSSQISNKSRNSSVSSYSSTRSGDSVSTLESTSELEGNKTTAFFSCIDSREIDHKPQYSSLLALCYHSLLNDSTLEKGDLLPEKLDTGMMSKRNTQGYLREKIDNFLNQGTAFKVLKEKDDKATGYRIEGEQNAINQLGILQGLLPSQKMFLAAETYERLADERGSLGDKKDLNYFKEKAKHTREYATQFQSHETIRQKHFV